MAGLFVRGGDGQGLGGDVGRGFGGVGDSRFVVGVDCWESAQQQAVDIGENRGTPRGDAFLGQEPVEGAQGMVDALSSLESLGLAGQSKGDVGTLPVLLRGAMLRAKRGLEVRSEKLALTPGGRAIGAAHGREGGFRGERFHFEPRKMKLGYPPPVFW